MIIWIDAQLSPALATWITASFGVESHALRDLGLQGAKDRRIFEAAREAEAIVMTKDSDFLMLPGTLGEPPQVLWITCGNTSNAHLRQLLKVSLPKALDLLRAGERLVEIGGSL